MLEALKNEGITELAATGYCFGGTFFFLFFFFCFFFVCCFSNPITTGFIYKTSSLHIWPRVRSYHQSRSRISPISPQDSWRSRGTTLFYFLFSYSLHSSKPFFFSAFLFNLQKYVSTSKAPLLVNSCTIDHLFPLEACDKADEILGGGKFAPGYKREHFEGCSHGFAVRGDLSDPKVKAGKEGSFKASVEWIKKYIWALAVVVFFFLFIYCQFRCVVVTWLIERI